MAMGKVSYHGLHNQWGVCSVIFQIDGIEYEYEMDCRKAETAHWLTGKSIWKALNFAKKWKHAVRKRNAVMDNQRLASELVKLAKSLIGSEGAVPASGGEPRSVCESENKEHRKRYAWMSEILYSNRVPQEVLDQHYHRVKKKLKLAAKLNGVPPYDYTKRVFLAYKEAAIALGHYAEVISEQEEEIRGKTADTGALLEIFRG